LKAMVSNMSDGEIWRLNRGGHDASKVYAAYHQAVHHEGRPTVILAKTVKGYGMGAAGEGQNITHQKKKLDEDDLKAFRDRFTMPLSDVDIAHLPFVKLPEESGEHRYLRDRRKTLGGFLPVRRTKAEELKTAALDFSKAQLEGRGDREIS